MIFNRTILKMTILLVLLGNIVNAINYAYAEEVIAQTHKLSKGDIKEFVENTVPKQLEKYNIPGASVSVVKDGQVLFTKAYGYRNISEGLKADSNTMFRIGSVTKLFTWTGIMQLVEQGKLNLDDDISKYLGNIKIGGNYKEPITIKNLMTHTSGIEDKFSNLFMGRDEEIPPLEEALLRDKRNRIFKPGEIVAYSNYGTALAGKIMENISGITYEEYIENNILKPLNMNRTTILQPASAKYDNVSKGHMYLKGDYKVFEDAFTQLPPIGAISTSSEDISKFMIMHLQNGRYEDKVILKEDTAKLMHKTHFPNDKRLPGICLGFIEWKRNHKRIIWHSGGTALFRTLCMLIPEENVGVFISYNSPNSDKARSEFRQKFLDRYYPYNVEKVKPLENHKERAKNYEGYFKEGRTAKFNSDKLIFALSRMEKVIPNDEGTLTFRGRKYIEVDSLVFYEVNGQGKLIFQEDENENIKYLFQDFEPHEAYMKIKWYENPQLSMIIFSLCMIIFLTTLITKFLQNILWKKNEKHRNDRKIEKLILLISMFHLLFPIGGVLGFVMEIWINSRVMTTGAIPLLFKLSLLPPVISGIITIITIPYVIRAWKNKDWTFNRRIYYSLVVVTSLIFIGWMYYWNLLGYFR
ncbi:MAG: beta-lactamase family protein [Anaeromicrobium sp.]|jgi:CubicO group peptidase (beta-lactamase class C family)|uniref:serine hydrolase domain-containing protein n=1 Tax=Anaeromicrobium sp. TaxID=1929132 RepID=UPI0025D5F52B|nr:serine hydrolase domain-containing protein [Anaeromicrobium sp.]MCT4593323.1 beta-lactamase family protein [Anaeromicrobium sp.]